MKKKLVLLVLCVVMLLGIYVYRIIEKNGPREVPASETIPSERLEDETSIPRAEAFRLVSYLYYSEEERSKLAGEIEYQDVSHEDWFYESMVAMYTAGFHNQIDQVNEKCYIRPLDGLNAHEGDMLFEKIAESFQISVSEIYLRSGVDLEGGTNQKVSRTSFLSLYETVVKMIENQNPLVKRESLYLLSVDSEGNLTTNQGKYYGGELFYGKEKMESIINQNLSTYIDGTLDVFTCNDYIIYVKGESETPVVLENVYIVHAKNNRMTAFVEGVTKEFELVSSLDTSLDSIVGNLTCVDHKITNISIKPDQVTDRVLLANEDYIELEHYGKVDYDSNFKIYKIYGDLKMEQTNSILVGYSNTKFVLNENKISAALITEPISVTNLRVMIMNNNYKSLFHEEVKLTCKSPFILYYGEQEKKYKGGKEVTLQTDSKYLKDGRVKVVAEDKESKIQLLSVKRKQGNPYYHGSIEIATTDRGLVVINEVALEEYLYSVLASEMPISYGKEALKVQAVCARSYAYKQILSNAYRQYGAHIDDSTSFQVYNNYAETKETIQAVDETCGQVISYDNQVITAYYFSTSCGCTSSMVDVWGAERGYEYLKGAIQTKERAELVKRMNKQLEDENEDATLEVMAENIWTPDFSDEKVFREFLTEKKHKTIEEEFAWYRWNTNLSYENITDTINQNLKGRYEVNPELILTQVTNNGELSYESKPIETIGDVTSIEVVERKSSGVVTKLKIVGTKQTILACSEYNIRAFLAPKKSVVNRQDESKIEELTLLPSAFFVLDKTEDGVKVTGGGYGHGVGMSQNGVKALADLGFHYEDMISYYYKGTELINLYR